MRDLGLCLRPFETGGQPLESHDARFLNITDLAQRGKFSEVADAVAELLAEEVYEVRLLGYYLFAVFHEEGMARLPEVFEVLAMLTRRMEEGLPEGDKQLKLLNKSLTWFLQTLLDTLRYHQSKTDARWAGWLKDGTESQATEAIERAEELLELLAAPTYASGAQKLALLVTWLREFKAQRPVPPPEKAAAVSPAKEDAAKAPAPAPAPESPSPFLHVGQTMQLRGSAHLVELCNKLKAFEMLIERKDFQKAALVSDDILGTLEGFDPRRYFPELFASFGGLLNKHVRDIQEHWENKDSTEWKTLSQFYQVDLENFVKRK
jgi:hypothetical protein